MSNKFEEMLERLINEDREGAEELFHEIVVEKSREIYETILEDDLEDETVEEAEHDDMEDEDEDEMDEGFDLDEFAVSSDDDADEMAGMDDMGGDAADDMLGDVGMDDEEDEEDKGEVEDRIQDVEDAIDELKAEFEKKLADIGGDVSDDDDDDDEGEESDDAPMGDMDDDKEEESYNFDEDEVDEVQQMREYVEKVVGGHGAESKGKAETADNTHSPVAGKNDMGGTAGNIVAGGEEKGGEHAGLADINPKDHSAGNVNVPGGKASKSMKAQPKGHGAEKKGAGETGAVNKKSALGS